MAIHFRPWHGAPVQGPQGFFSKESNGWIDDKYDWLPVKENGSWDLVDNAWFQLGQRQSLAFVMVIAAAFLRTRNTSSKAGTATASSGWLRLATGHHCGIRRIRTRCQRPVECHRPVNRGLGHISDDGMLA